MRYSLALPADDPARLLRAARTLERHGIDAGFLTDHPAPDTRWLAAGGHHALEPTVALAAAGAATSSLRLHTHIYVLAYRNPFLAAKALTTLDALAPGRLILGVGAGYLRPEFTALGVPFDERGDRLDESLEVLRALWAGEVVAGSGAGWSAKGVEQSPAPASPPPIWIGGNSAAARRRVAQHGQGWSPFPTPEGLADAARTASMATVADVTRGVEQLAEELDRVGRNPADVDVCFGPFGFERYLAGEIPAEEMRHQIAELERAGVTWLTLSPDAPDHAGYEAQVARIADELVAPEGRA